MLHKAWSIIEEVPYCLWRSPVKFQGDTARKSVKFDPDWAFLDCISSLNWPMATKWYTKLEVSQKSCPIVFEGHPSNLKVTRLKEMVDLDPNWAFPDCNSSLNSPMATKCCTKLELNIEEVPSCFWRSSVKFQGHLDKKSSILTQNRRFWTGTPVEFTNGYKMLQKA